MVLGGLRAAEVRSVRLADIDMGRRQLRVVGKGGRERVVPVDGAFFAELVAYLRSERPLGCRTPECFVVLRGPTRGAPMTEAGMRKIFRTHRERSGATRVRPHRLRHTYGEPLRPWKGVDEAELVVDLASKVPIGIAMDRVRPPRNQQIARPAPLLRVDGSPRRGDLLRQTIGRNRNLRQNHLAERVPQECVARSGHHSAYLSSEQLSRRRPGTAPIELSRPLARQNTQRHRPGVTCAEDADQSNVTTSVAGHRRLRLRQRTRLVPDLG